MEVRDLLKQQGKDCTGPAVAACMSSVHVDSSPKSVATKLQLGRGFLLLVARGCSSRRRKIYARFTPGAQALLDQLDTACGPLKHCFGFIANLDILCQKTSCKQAKVQDHLLEWCLQGFYLGPLSEMSRRVCFQASSTATP